MRKRDIDLILSIVGLIIIITTYVNIKYLGTKDFSSHFESTIWGLLGLLTIIIVVIIAIGIFIRYLLNKKNSNLGSKSGVKTTIKSSAIDKYQNESENLKEYKNFGEKISIQSIGEFFEKLREIDWYQFEQITAIIYKTAGYKVTRPSGYKPDGGIDLIVEKDGIQWAVQCKHWKTRNVGVKAVREFLGALQDSGINRGIFITLYGYTHEAKQFAERNGIEIMNETNLLKLIDQTNARFNPEITAFLNDTRKFCPKCGNEMVLRVAKKGILSGKKFWGCTAYPACHYKINIED